MIVPLVRLFPHLRLNKIYNPLILTLPVMLYCFVKQVLNYRLLGNKLSEGKSQEGFLSSLIDEVIQVLVFPFSFNKIRNSFLWIYQSFCACAVGDVLTFYMSTKAICKEKSDMTIATG